MIEDIESSWSDTDAETPSTIDMPKKQRSSKEFNGVPGLHEAPLEENEYAEFSIQRGRYISRDLLARGGMKSIARVRDMATSRDVAMAYLTECDFARAGVRSRFIEEAKITANLEHPNIVPIHDIGVIPNQSPYFTMKMLGGESLAHILSKVKKNTDDYRERYPLSELLMIYLKVLDAIEFAHAKGIVHLDLKPDNIQVGEFGEVVVLDWGLARTTARFHKTGRNNAIYRMIPSDAQTMDGEIKGTIGYMAPEQAAGRNDEKDERTDIYALGAILFTILGWERSIEAPGTDKSKFDQALHDITSGYIRPLHNLERPIPQALKAVTMKAMSLKQDERYQSVSELRKEVMDFIAGFATQAERANLVRRSSLWMHRHRAFAITMTLFILSILVAGFFVWQNMQREVARWGHERILMPVSRPSDKNRWVVRDGDWNVTNDAVSATGVHERPARIQFAQPFYGNIAVEFKAMVENRESLSSGAELSLLLNWTDPGSNAPQDDCYTFQLGGLSNTVAGIQRQNGFQSIIPFQVEPGRTYTIRVEKEGEKLRLYCDGALLTSVDDLFYLEGGYLGFATIGSGKRFWDIKIYERGLPELISPLSVGEDYYRTGRSQTDIRQKHNFMNLARNQFHRVAIQYAKTQLGHQAVLRRAYVNIELGNLLAVESDIMELEQDYNDHSLRTALLKGELALSTQKFTAAYDIYSRAITQFPESVNDITGTLMTRLNDNLLFKDQEYYREHFARLVAENQKGKVFRFRTKGIESLEFLSSLRFEMLDISKNHIRDITPIRTMNLRYLNIADNPITSLEPLRGMPLAELYCNATAIASIEPLRNSKIKTLCLHQCTQLSDIDALQTLVELERLSLPPHLPKEAIIKLQIALPKLKYIQFNDNHWRLSPERFFTQVRMR